MTVPSPVAPEVRTVLGAPRGRRFSRPGVPASPTPRTREQRLLAQMPDNPRVVYRQAHGQIPAWMDTHAARLTANDNPRPARRSEPAPAPAPERTPTPRVPRPHRKPRRPGRTAWRLTAYALAALAGALAHHLAAPLL